MQYKESIAKCDRFIWVSRHPLTNGQIETIKYMGFKRKLIIGNINIDFSLKPWKDLESFDIKPATYPVIGVVAPTYVTLALLRKGFRIIEFVNKPSARQKGVFICEGAYFHGPSASKFFPCPIAPKEQEKGSLSPMG